MGILGTGHPIITDTDGINSLTLSYAFGRDFDYEDTDLEHYSKISGQKTYITKGDHLIFKCHVNVFRNTDIGTSYDNVKAFYKTEVLLYPFGTQVIVDEDGVAVPFFFRKLFPYFMDTNDYKTRLYLEFESTKFIVIPSGTDGPGETGTYRVTEDGDRRITEDGDDRIL